MLTTVALLGLVALAVWRLGSVALPWGGATTAVVSLVLTSGSARLTLPGVIFGTVAWLAGHWLFAVRHQFYGSPLARRIFLQVLPARLNPTRHWGVRVIQ